MSNTYIYFGTLCYFLKGVLVEVVIIEFVVGDDIICLHYKGERGIR